MILRRLTQHVRDQNWFAVALDFFIVVFGVFIGFQLTAWGERRATHARAEAYLVRIEADLASDRENLLGRRAFWDEVVANGRAAAAYAETGTLHEDSAWSTLRAFLHASHVWRFKFNDTTYAEARSAGELGLIGDAELRDALAYYYVFTLERREDGLYSLLPAYREMVRGRVRSDVMRYYWDACQHQEYGVQSLKDCPAPVDEAEARDMVDALAADVGLIDALRFWIDNLALASALTELDTGAADRLSARIEAAK